ncbi:MAG: amidohydrolase family protein, partial [Candidatus Micrarchaeaceae archaeon]
FKGRTLISPSIGVQGVYVASDSTLARAKEIAEENRVLLHMHLAETKKEVADYLREKGETPLAHLYNMGFLDESVVAAHCVWLSGKEIGMLAKSKASVSWNAISNSKLASGNALVREMLAKGVNVTIGTDSSGSNNSLSMLESMKFSALAMKNQYRDAAVISAQKIFDMATTNAARALHRRDLGSIEKGKAADIVLVDIAAPNMAPSSASNIINNIVYSANPSNIKYVIVGGRILKGAQKNLADAHF